MKKGKKESTTTQPSSQEENQAEDLHILVGTFTKLWTVTIRFVMFTLYTDCINHGDHINQGVYKLW